MQRRRAVTTNSKKLPNLLNLQKFTQIQIKWSQSQPAHRKQEPDLPWNKTQVILQVTDEEDQEFPEELNNLIYTLYPIDTEITETRKVYLNNDWQVTDTIGNPDFIGLIEENSNMDLLSFITDKLPY